MADHQARMNCIFCAYCNTKVAFDKENPYKWVPFWQCDDCRDPLVHYCSRYHQMMDWSEHYKSCLGGMSTYPDPAENGILVMPKLIADTDVRDAFIQSLTPLPSTGTTLFDGFTLEEQIDLLVHAHLLRLTDEHEHGSKRRGPNAAQDTNQCLNQTLQLAIKRGNVLPQEWVPSLLPRVSNTVLNRPTCYLTQDLTADMVLAYHPTKPHIVELLRAISSQIEGCVSAI